MESSSVIAMGLQSACLSHLPPSGGKRINQTKALNVAL